MTFSSWTRQSLSAHHPLPSWRRLTYLSRSSLAVCPTCVRSVTWFPPCSIPQVCTVHLSFADSFILQHLFTSFFQSWVTSCVDLYAALETFFSFILPYSFLYWRWSVLDSANIYVFTFKYLHIFIFWGRLCWINFSAVYCFFLPFNSNILRMIIRCDGILVKLVLIVQLNCFEATALHYQDIKEHRTACRFSCGPLYRVV